MHRRVLLLLAASSLLCVVGCGSSNKGKIEGTKWVHADSAYHLEFKKDGTVIYKVPAGQAYTGKYELGGGKKVTFTFNEAVNGKKVVVKQITIGEEDEFGPEGDPTGQKHMALWCVEEDGKEHKYLAEK